MKESKMFLGAFPNTFRRADELRHNETPAEKILWSRLSNKQLGVKFRRQHPIIHYIVDFYCHAHKLVVEVDGEIHRSKENEFYDRLRTEDLEQSGLRVIRFENQEVFNAPDSVVERIKQEIRNTGNL